METADYFDQLVGYLQTAAIAGFSDKQILEETNELFHMSHSKIPASWRKLMKQYSKALSRYTDKVADEVHIKLNQNK